ncbi:hypothetical protein INT46_004663 [Mucor plumbeus]|uniref:OTU domain-containing protein n=1 Tax=Mucor plumbeus TaxID=97098 RepID=A0A8H7QDI3_9FUNG|nr:hypothetical protein INT46_004663 [Mucor plumbeus]
MVAEKKTRQFIEQLVKAKSSNEDESLKLYEKLIPDEVDIKSEQEEVTVKTTENNIAPATENSRLQRGTKRKLSDGMVEVTSKRKPSILNEEKKYGICRDPTKFSKGSKLHNLAKLYSSILPYYRDIVDIKRNGNCGYRALSYQLYDGNQREYLRFNAPERAQVAACTLSRP